MEPLVLSFWIFVGVGAATWLLSVLTREYSWTDRLWSIAPIIYVWVFAAADLDNARLVLMAVLVTLWGARLTFNFARKGGYAKGGEDYRWAELRKKMSPALFQVFNFGFIALYQNVLLLLIALPAAIALERTETPFGVLDVIATVLFLAFLAGETIADEQQWRFHQDKHARKARGIAVGHGADDRFRGLVRAFEITRKPRSPAREFARQRFEHVVVAGVGIDVVLAVDIDDGYGRVANPPPARDFRDFLIHGASYCLKASARSIPS